MQGLTIFNVEGEDALTYNCDHDDLVECVVVDSPYGGRLVLWGRTVPIAASDITAGADKVLSDNPAIRKLTINAELTAAWRELAGIEEKARNIRAGLCQHPDHERLEQLFKGINNAAAVGRIAVARAHQKARVAKLEKTSVQP